MNFLAGFLTSLCIVGAACAAMVAATAEEPEAARSSCVIDFTSIGWRNNRPIIEGFFLPCSDTALALAWREV